MNGVVISLFDRLVSSAWRAEQRAQGAESRGWLHEAAFFAGQAEGLRAAASLLTAVGTCESCAGAWAVNDAWPVPRIATEPVVASRTPAAGAAGVPSEQ
jgi:hypothetical protein